MAKFENLNNLTEALKNICILIFYLMIFGIAIFIGIPFIKQQVNDKEHKWELNEIEVAGFKLSKASNEINTRDRTQNVKASDIKVDIASIPTANYLDTTLQEKVKSYWVYVGQFDDDGKWLTKNFSFNTPITKIKSINDVYKRESAPIQLTEDDWKLGKIIGLVSKGTTLQSVKVDTIAGNNIWATVY